MALVTIAEVKSALGLGSLYADSVIQAICDTSEALIEAYVTAESFAAEPEPMKQAALALSIDLFQAQRAAGGQLVAADFQPSPFRLGRSFTAKVSGLLAPYLDAGGMVG